MALERIGLISTYLLNIQRSLLVNVQKITRNVKVILTIVAPLLHVETEVTGTRLFYWTSYVLGCLGIRSVIGASVATVSEVRMVAMSEYSTNAVIWKRDPQNEFNNTAFL